MRSAAPVPYSSLKERTTALAAGLKRRCGWKSTRGWPFSSCHPLAVMTTGPTLGVHGWSHSPGPYDDARSQTELGVNLTLVVLNSWTFVVSALSTANWVTSVSPTCVVVPLKTRLSAGRAVPSDPSGVARLRSPLHAAVSSTVVAASRQPRRRPTLMRAICRVCVERRMRLRVATGDDHVPREVLDRVHEDAIPHRCRQRRRQELADGSALGVLVQVR